MLGDEVNYRLKILEKQVDKMDETCKQMNNRLLCVENVQGNIEITLDNFSKHTEAIVKMTYEVKNLSNKFSDALVEMDNHEDRLTKIESTPGSIAVRAWVYVLTTVCASVMGIVVGTYI